MHSISEVKSGENHLRVSTWFSEDFKPLSDQYSISLSQT